ncbi:MAG: electron transfer flavoprotein subunit alpha [Rickettsiales bacterium]|jgi:electron transfer flavoprotein alpha subunit|nr:electron transfer flavoprotein subunit alpha [Rickettsiales bacterium]
MTVLVIAEHDNKHIKSSTLATVTAAKALNSGDVHLLVIGQNCAQVADVAADITGIAKVLMVVGEPYGHFLAENIAPAVVEIAKNYSHILAPSTTFGKDIMPRIAALLDVAQVTDVIGIVSADTFKRPIYAGNVIATVQSSDPIKLLTIRTTAFENAAIADCNAAVDMVTGKADSGLSSFVSQQITKSDRPELTSAKIVVSGGRGFGSAENFGLLNKLADKLGAAVGASRAAVDAGYAPNDYQVGQTGKIVAPDVYFAIGISGAIQHLAGMKDSRIIVAINKDENAPIFEVADFGLVTDLFTALSELEKQL